jgi:hypothetical protein
MKAKTKLTKELKHFFDNITKSNYLSKYDELSSLLLSYREFLSKDEVSKILHQFYLDNKGELIDFKDDVLGEISNRLSHYTSDSKKINW